MPRLLLLAPRLARGLRGSQLVNGRNWPTAKPASVFSTDAAARGVSGRLGTAAASTLAGGSAGFRCGECGHEYAKWQGQCVSCDAWGAIERVKRVVPQFRQSNADAFAKGKKSSHHGVSWASHKGREAFDGRHEAREHRPLRMNDVEIATVAERLELPERELV